MESGPDDPDPDEGSGKAGEAGSWEVCRCL